MQNKESLYSKDWIAKGDNDLDAARILLEAKNLQSASFHIQQAEELQIPFSYNLLIYRIAQELLTNMAKHSQAKNVVLSLNKKENFLEFFYEDDGVGFSYGQISALPRRREEDKFKLGLMGLKERTELLDGSMHIDSVPGRGTKITVKLPV